MQSQQLIDMTEKKTTNSTGYSNSDQWLWDSNPKLLPVLNSIDFSLVENGFMGIAAFRKEKGLSSLKAPYQFNKNQSKNDTYFGDLLEGFDQANLTDLLQEATYWWNIEEIEFIAASWYKKEKRFNDLKN